MSCKSTFSWPTLYSEEALSSIRSTTLYYQALLENFQSKLTSPSDICHSLQADKERFLKLKHNFLVQDAKEKFLKSILEFPPVFTSQEEVLRLGMSVMTLMSRTTH
jgi:hypothetical protein